MNLELTWTPWGKQCQSRQISCRKEEQTQEKECWIFFVNWDWITWWCEIKVIHHTDLFHVKSQLYYLTHDWFFIACPARLYPICVRSYLSVVCEFSSQNHSIALRRYNLALCVDENSIRNTLTNLWYSSKERFWFNFHKIWRECCNLQVIISYGVFPDFVI